MKNIFKHGKKVVSNSGSEVILVIGINKILEDFDLKTKKEKNCFSGVLIGKTKESNNSLWEFCNYWSKDCFRLPKKNEIKNILKGV